MSDYPLPDSPLSAASQGGSSLASSFSNSWNGQLGTLPLNRNTSEGGLPASRVLSDADEVFGTPPRLDGSRNSRNSKDSNDGTQNPDTGSGGRAGGATSLKGSINSSNGGRTSAGDVNSAAAHQSEPSSALGISAAGLSPPRDWAVGGTSYSDYNRSGHGGSPERSSVIQPQRPTSARPPSGTTRSSNLGSSRPNSGANRPPSGTRPPSGRAARPPSNSSQGMGAGIGRK